MLIGPRSLSSRLVRSPSTLPPLVGYGPRSNGLFSAPVSDTMEYYLFTTKGCNLRCPYCFEVEKQMGSKPTYPLDDLVHFFIMINWGNRQATGHSPRRNDITYYGGEPLMNMPFIEEVMHATQDLGMGHVLQTNGTLLNRASDYLLENLSYILVSVDGTKEAHDKNRKFADGSGSYDLIMRNMGLIKPRFKGQTIARITQLIDPESSIYESVMAVIDLFDAVHWQIESPMRPGVAENKALQEAFLERYDKDIKKLMDYWMENMRRGIIKNIIPFQAMTSAMINKERHRFLRCGCGSSLVAIDLDGQCYGCDTLVGKEGAKIGDIWKGISFGKIPQPAQDPNSLCAKCDIVDFCGGRCLHGHYRFK